MSPDAKELEKLLGLSEQMAVAAEKEDWVELESIAEQYFPLFGRLSPRLGSPTTAAALRTLMTNQQRVMDSAEPWMSATRTLLDTWASLRRSEPPPSTSSE